MNLILLAWRSVYLLLLLLLVVVFASRNWMPLESQRVRLRLSVTRFVCWKGSSKSSPQET